MTDVMLNRRAISGAANLHCGCLMAGRTGGRGINRDQVP